MEQLRSFRRAVGVLGAGRWGTTLAHLAAQRGLEVRLWSEDELLVARIKSEGRNVASLPELDQLHPRVQPTARLLDVAKECHLLLVAVPVAKLRPLMRQLGEVADGAHMVVHAVRGLEAETFAVPSRVIAEETCVRQVGALLGAALVDELLRGRPNAALVASRFPEVVAATQTALSGEALRLQGHADLVGVETAAAAASAIALGLGMCQQAGYGPAALAAVVARGAGEVARLAQAGGGEATTGYGLAGLGYLMLERESDSRDVQAGRHLAQGQSLAELTATLGPVDATQAARSLATLARERKVQAPMVQAVAAVLDGRTAAADAVAQMIG